MDKVRFGVIGCGVIGKMHAGVICSIPGAILAGAADVNPALSKALAEDYGCSSYESYTDILKRDDIDAVAVCLPSGMHCKAAADAAMAGKHVIVEKPIEIETDRAKVMIDICRRYGVKLSVIMQHRFDEAVQALKKCVDSGNMGGLYMGTSRTIWYREPQYYAGSSWRGTWKLDGGGALINQSIHYIDLLLYIMGPVESVSGKCRTLFHKNIEVEDTGIAVLQFKNGAVGTIEGTTVAYPGLFTELCVYGEKGSIIIRNDRLEHYGFKDGEKPEFKELLNRKDEENGTGSSRAEGLAASSHRKQYEDVIDSIKNDREPLVTGEEGIRALAVIKAIYESSKSHKEIEVNI
jgi:predicted dehydrogenase